MKIVHCKKEKYDIYIGRPSEWGNPFSHLPNTLAKYKTNTREEAVKKYEKWILNNSKLLEKLPVLRNKILGCWCKPKICHGDILIKLLKEYTMIEVYKYHPDAKLPIKKYEEDGAYDLTAVEDVFIPKSSTKTVRTGIAVNIPEGYRAQLKERSSMAINGLRVSGGLIDSGYNGEIVVIINNISCNKDALKYDIDSPYYHERITQVKELGYQIKKGDRIAQLKLEKNEKACFVEVKELWKSDRGQSGLGSSGR